MPLAASPPPSSVSNPAPGWATALRWVAAIYYLCLVLAAAKACEWASDSAGWADSALWVLRTRQCLLSGLCLLAACAMGQALLKRWPQVTSAQVWALRAIAVVAGAMLGALARHAVVNWLEAPYPMNWPWWWSTSALWAQWGGLAWAGWRWWQASTLARTRWEQARRDMENLNNQHLQARLYALHAQIEPHFLFNTLATVKRLLEVSPAQGQAMLGDLMACLRAALPGMRSGQATLADEFTLVAHYLDIHKARMGPRLQHSLLLPPELARAQIPGMLVLTLVENALKHGLAPQIQGGWVWVSARALPPEEQGDSDRNPPQPSHLEIVVEDTGQGLQDSAGSGVGLANSRARLAALHGNAAGLSLEAVSPHGLPVRVHLPWVETQEAS